MSNKDSTVQAELIKQCFPSSREQWREHYPQPRPGAKTMTRQEHIDHSIVSISGVMFPCRFYEVLYYELIGKPVSKYSEFAEIGFDVYPTWDELIIKFKPWLANDEEFAKWQALEPFDRFRLMVCGLPWNDEVIELLKQDNGVKHG